MTATTTSEIVTLSDAQSKSKREGCRVDVLLILTVGSVFVGIAVGFSLRNSGLSPLAIELIGFPGELFMNMLKMLIVPLIAASLISGLSQMDTRTSGKITAYAFFFYFVTLSSAVILGMILVIIIHPGDPSIKASLNLDDDRPANVSAIEKILDLLRNMFPDNIVRSTFQQRETSHRLESSRMLMGNNVTKVTVMKAYIKYTDGMNVLGLIVFFIAMGLVMGHLGETAKPLADVFSALDVVITKLVGIIMWYSPVGIASLIAQKILEISDLGRTAQTLGVYMLTVTIGLIIHCLVVLPLILFLASRKNPYTYLRGMSQAAMTAFGTASSAATLPVTFKCIEQNNNVSPMYTKFVLPVGAIINMDGTALYEAVASVFIAQINGMEMDIGNVLIISITATLASIGAASIPSAGLVTMLIVLTAAGLPANDVTLIIAVDWLLDRLRTVVNVMGDGIGCGFVQAMVERDGGVHVNAGNESTNRLTLSSGSLATFDNSANNKMMPLFEQSFPRLSAPSNDMPPRNGTNPTLVGHNGNGGSISIHVGNP